MAAIVNSNQNQVIDISPLCIPHLRQAGIEEGPNESVFFASETDLDRVAELCKQLLTASAQNLTEMLHIHRCICQLVYESLEIQDKASVVAATVLNTFTEALCKDPKDVRKQVFESYFRSPPLRGLYIPLNNGPVLDTPFDRAERIVPLRDLPPPLDGVWIDEDPREGLCPPLDLFVRSILRAANELYGVYPEQAKKCVDYVNQIVSLIHCWKRNPNIAESEKAMALERLPSPLCLLEWQTRVLELVPGVDPDWERKLRAVLKATSTLYCFLQARVVAALYKPMSRLWQTPGFPGFSNLTTVKLLRSLFQGHFKWHYEHPQEMTDLLSRYGNGIVRELELANFPQQIACLQRLIQLPGEWKGFSFTPRSLDATCAQGLLSRVNDLAKSFPEGEVYTILASLAPEVARAYVNIFVEGLKKATASDDIIVQWRGLNQMVKPCLLDAPEPGRIIREFVDEWLRAIARDIGQGRICLETIDKNELGRLCDAFIKRYKNNMESLIKTLGDHAKTFFEIYSVWKSQIIYISFCAGDLVKTLQDLKEYIQIPPGCRKYERDDPFREIFFNDGRKRFFRQKMEPSKVLEFGQLCYWLNRLFSANMPPLPLSEDIFQSLKERLLHAAPLQSLDGKGYEDPVKLIEALPIDEAQKAQLFQVYQFVL